MPKRVNGVIPEIYKKNYETIGMFFWVQAQQKILPTISAKESIEKYLTFIGWEWDIEVAMNTYNRIKKEYLKNG